MHIGTAVFPTDYEGWATLRAHARGAVAILAPLTGGLQIGRLKVPAGSSGVIPLPASSAPLRYRLDDPADAARLIFSTE